MFFQSGGIHATRSVRRSHAVVLGEFAIVRGELQRMGEAAEREPGAIMRRRSRKILLRILHGERLFAGEMSRHGKFAPSEFLQSAPRPAGATAAGSVLQAAVVFAIAFVSAYPLKWRGPGGDSAEPSHSRSAGL